MNQPKEYQEAALVWLKQHPGKVLDECTYEMNVELANGKVVRLGRYLTSLRRGYKNVQQGKYDAYYSVLTESDIRWWNEHGLSWNSSLFRRRVYQEAALVWLKENPEKCLSHCTQRTNVTLEDGRVVGLGSYLCRIRKMDVISIEKGEENGESVPLTKEEVVWWKEHGLVFKGNFRKKTDYRSAALVWLKEHPGKKLADCNSYVEVVLESGEVVQLGLYILRIRGIYNAMQKGKKYSSYKDLSEEEIAWWSEHGMDWRLHFVSLREKYQEAALIWLEANPGKKLSDCTEFTTVTLKNGEEVCLDNYLCSIRRIYQAMQKGKKYSSYKDLSKEEIAWWSEHGMVWEDVIPKQGKRGKRKKQMDYQEAALVWLKQNPGKTIADCYQTTIVTLENGKVVCLGSYLNRIKMIYSAMQCDERYGTQRRLTDDEIAWWKDLGMNFKCSYRKPEKLYKRAAVIWLQKHSGKTLADCGDSEMVTLETGRIVDLGAYIVQLKSIYMAMQEDVANCSKSLTDDEIAWWSNHGLVWESNDLLDGWLDVYKQIIRRFNREKIWDNDTLMKITDAALKTYLLTPNEKKLLYQSLKKYLLGVKERGIQRVGTITDEEQKIEKIRQYGLDEFDIEESFFVPFWQRKNAPFHKKYEILRGYIIDWNYYSEEEKQSIQRQNEFGLEDMEYIQTMRQNIDNLIQKVKKLSK